MATNADDDLLGLFVGRSSNRHSKPAPARNPPPATAPAAPPPAKPAKPAKRAAAVAVAPDDAPVISTMKGGRPPGPPGTRWVDRMRRAAFHLPIDLLDELDRPAARGGATKSAFVAAAIRNELARTRRR